MKTGDYLIIAFALLVATGFSLYAAHRSDDSGYLEVRADGETYIYALSEDRELTFSGPLGETHVHISGGRAHISESPCRDKTCVTMGWIEHGGEWAACLPNRVFITVQGAPDGDGAPDAVAR